MLTTISALNIKWIYATQWSAVKTMGHNSWHTRFGCVLSSLPWVWITSHTFYKFVKFYWSFYEQWNVQILTCIQQKFVHSQHGRIQSSTYMQWKKKKRTNEQNWKARQQYSFLWFLIQIKNELHWVIPYTDKSLSQNSQYNKTSKLHKNEYVKMWNYYKNMYNYSNKCSSM